MKIRRFDIGQSPTYYSSLIGRGIQGLGRKNYTEKQILNLVKSEIKIMKLIQKYRKKREIKLLGEI